MKKRTQKHIKNNPNAKGLSKIMINSQCQKIEIQICITENLTAMQVTMKKFVTQSGKI